MLESASISINSIKMIGIRPGEKIHETLISPIESVRTIEDGEFYIILPQIKIPEVDKKYLKFSKLSEFRYSSDLTNRINKNELKRILTKEKLI